MFPPKPVLRMNATPTVPLPATGASHSEPNVNQDTSSVSSQGTIVHLSMKNANVLLVESFDNPESRILDVHSSLVFESKSFDNSQEWKIFLSSTEIFTCQTLQQYTVLETQFAKALAGHSRDTSMARALTKHAHSFILTSSSSVDGYECSSYMRFQADAISAEVSDQDCWVCINCLDKQSTLGRGTMDKGDPAEAKPDQLNKRRLECAAKSIQVTLLSTCAPDLNTPFLLCSFSDLQLVQNT